jgi:HlyD family secretion protein
MNNAGELREQLRSLSIPRASRPAERGTAARGGSWTGRILLSVLMLALGAGGMYVLRPYLPDSPQRPAEAAGAPASTRHEPAAAPPPAADAPVLTASGKIVSDHRAAVSTKVSGQIVSLSFEQGDRVEAGQELVRIERDLLESQVREAEAALRQARVELRYAKLAVDRVEEMKRSDAASLQKRDDAAARFEQAQAAVARAEAALQSLSTQLGYATVLSPLSGRVLEIPVEEGSAVSPVTAVTGGTLLLSLAGTDRLHLKGLVDENEVARVALGQPARIRTEAYGDRTFQGVVTEIAPLGQRVQNVTYFELEIEITDPDAALLRPRMSGDAEIVTEVVADALVVPETALFYRGKDITVQVLSGRDGRRRAEERAVSIGIVDGARVQVLSGLEAGEEVRLQ